MTNRLEKVMPYIIKTGLDFDKSLKEICHHGWCQIDHIASATPGKEIDIDFYTNSV